MRKMKIDRDIASRREAEFSSQISTLEETVSEHNALLQQYFAHIKEQEGEIESLKNENGK